MLLPRHPLVRAPLDDPPFRERSFGGLWLSSAFTHLPRSAWRPTFATLLRFLGPGRSTSAACVARPTSNRSTDPVLGRVYVSSAVEAEVEALFTSHGLTDVSVEVRPDPILDRRRPWVVALGRLAR
jgi:hypothetical protein